MPVAGVDSTVRALPTDEEAGNPDLPDVVGTYHVALQVVSCSASCDDFLDVWANFLVNDV